MPSYAALHAGPTTATEPLRRWTCRRTTLDTYIWRLRPSPWCLQPGVMPTTAGLLGIGRGLLKSATPLDWTTRAALPGYADRRRSSCAGLTRVETGWRRRLLQLNPWLAWTMLGYYLETFCCTYLAWQVIQSYVLYLITISFLKGPLYWIDVMLLILLFTISLECRIISI
jgi:hypothetical protein